MPEQTLQINAGVGGLSFNGTIKRNSEGLVGHEVILPAADAGVLTTRTDNDTGTLTMGSAQHGITTGATVDVFWEIAGVKGKRIGMTVGTVSGTSVPIDLGVGDNLPAQASAVTVDVQVPVDIDFQGDDLEILAVQSKEGDAYVALKAAGTTHLALDLEAGEPYAWASGQGVTNPVAGDTIDNATISNRDATKATTIKIGAAINSV